MNLTGLDIESLTQHWVIIDGDWYREAWVRDTATGCLRYVAILDELL